MTCNILLGDMIEFFNEESIPFSILGLEKTYFFNSILDKFWLGTTGKIDWSYISGIIQKIEFPSEMNSEVINEILKYQNFKVFTSKKIALYFSGSENCIIVESCFFIQIIFKFMSNFCFLDSIIIFENIDIEAKLENIKFIELKFFEYICGQVAS